MANLKKEDLLKEIPGDKSKKRFTIINDKIKNKSVRLENLDVEKKAIDRL